MRVALLSVLLSSCTDARHVGLQEFRIDLDSQPEDRYLNILPAFNATLWGFYRKYFETDHILRDALYALSFARGDEPEEMQRELHGIAAVTKLPIRWVMSLQMLYELQTLLPPLYNNGSEYGTARALPRGYEALARVPWRGPGCTGIIASDASGVVHHARNLDFSPVDVMGKLMYVGVFTKGGKEVFRAQMAAGYAQIVTAMRHGEDGYTVERNTRYDDQWAGLGHTLQHLFAGRPLNGWTLRGVLTRVASYDAAVREIAAAPFVSPEYSIMSGVRKGTVLARDPDRVAHTQTLGEPNFEERSDYIIMTNFDFYWHDLREWLDPTAGIGLFHPRRLAAQKLLNATSVGGITPEVLFETINARGVLATDTVFQAIMSVEKGLWNASQPCSVVAC